MCARSHRVRRGGAAEPAVHGGPRRLGGLVHAPADKNHRHNQNQFGHSKCLAVNRKDFTQIAFDVMRVLGTNAIFVFAGVPDHKAPIEVDTALLIRDHVLKNQAVLGSVNADSANFEAAIRDLSVFKQRWPRALRSLITGYSPIELAPQLLLGNTGGIKNVVTFKS